MAEVGAAFASGLGQGAQQFGQALMNVSGINRERDRRAFERGLGVANLELERKAEKRRQRYYKQRGDYYDDRLDIQRGELESERDLNEARKQYYRNRGVGYQLRSVADLEDARRGGGVELRGVNSPYDPVQQPEQYDQWVESVEGPIQGVREQYEERERPTFKQSLEDIVNPAYETGETEFDASEGEYRPQYSLSAPARAAKADSLAAGELTASEFASRFEGGQGQQRGGQGTPPPDVAEGETSGPGTDAETQTPEAWDGPGDFNRWVENVEGVKAKGASDEELRNALTERGLNDQQIELIMEEAQ